MIMKTEAIEVLNAPRHRRTFQVEQIRSERFELSFLPEFGCQWTRLRVSVKGEWADFLRPIPDGDLLLDAKSGHGSNILAPWSNRIPGGVFSFEGRSIRSGRTYVTALPSTATCDGGPGR